MLIKKLIEKSAERERSNFSRPTNVVSFKPVCAYANFEDLAEEIIVHNDDTNRDEPEFLVKHALVAIDGEFPDSSGVPHKFTPERLETIAEHTNHALERGVNVPVCVDHKKEFDKTVGALGDNARAYTKVIEESDLPNKRARHLIGKVGLFIDDVVIKAKNAIEQVKQGVVTSVSMGLNLDPKEHRIVELSLVPIPAIPHMGLFALGAVDNTGENSAFTWEELETSQQTLDELRDEYNELTQKLWTLLDNIYTSESADITDLMTLKQYVYSALNGFSLRILDILGLTDVPDRADAAAMNADQQQMQQQTMSQDVSSPAQQQAIYYREPRGLLEFAKYINSSTKAVKYF